MAEQLPDGIGVILERLQTSKDRLDGYDRRFEKMELQLSTLLNLQYVPRALDELKVDVKAVRDKIEQAERDRREREQYLEQAHQSAAGFVDTRLQNARSNYTTYIVLAVGIVMSLLTTLFSVLLRKV